MLRPRRLEPSNPRLPASGFRAAFGRSRRTSCTPHLARRFRVFFARRALRKFESDFLQTI